MKQYAKHLITVLRHKWFVMMECFNAGLVWQGLTHDLSKFGLAEFAASARYFQGDKSPIEAEKTARGYSLAWQHHMGRNKHHWQYWIDFEQGKMVLIPMPAEYLVEMLCDWIGASKAYNAGSWEPLTLTNWLRANMPNMHLHTSTRGYVERFHSAVEKAPFVKTIRSFMDVDRVRRDYWQDDCEGCSYQQKIPVNSRIS